MNSAIIVALLLAAQGEPAAPAPPPVQKITKPEWVDKPSGEAVARAYPDLALRLEIGARVRLSCKVTATGEVANCRVLDETPEELGFGVAAIQLSQYFRMKTTSADGQPTAGATVIIPLSFTAPDAFRGAGEPRTYRIALSCITWNRARLDVLNDPTTTTSLAQAERYARTLGAREGKAQAAIDADIAEAGEGGVAARERMRSNPFGSSYCLFLPI